MITPWIPAMFRYVELHNIYRDKANQDAETILTQVQQFLESANRSRCVDSKL